MSVTTYLTLFSPSSPLLRLLPPSGSPLIFWKKYTIWVLLEPAYRREAAFVCWLICHFPLRTRFMLNVTLCPQCLYVLHVGIIQLMLAVNEHDNGNECALRIKVCFHFRAVQALLDALDEFFYSWIGKRFFSADYRLKMYPFLSASFLCASFYIGFNKGISSESSHSSLFIPFPFSLNSISILAIPHSPCQRLSYPWNLAWSSQPERSPPKLFVHILFLFFLCV